MYINYIRPVAPDGGWSWLMSSIGVNDPSLVLQRVLLRILARAFRVTR